MGNFVEKDQVAVPADFQPKAKQTSPYLTTPISFLIGPKGARYTVPRAFLSKSSQWSKLHAPNSDFWGNDPRIVLPGVNEDVGHTLVHYLYTGTFQKLQSSEDDDLTTELKKNVHLYGIAAKYGLAGLGELALEKIQNKERLGDIFDILETIKEAFKTFLNDVLGLKPYIMRELKAAFESDDTLFGKQRFIELFGEAKQFDQILMRTVAEIYSEKIAHISQNNPAIINESPVEAIFTTRAPSPLSGHEALREEPAYEEPAWYGEPDEYEKPSVCEHPDTFEDLGFKKLVLSEGYPVQKRVPTLEKESYEDLVVNKADLPEEYPVQKRVPALEKASSEKSEVTTRKSSLWDDPLHPDQDFSTGHPPVYPQSPSEVGFLPGVVEELQEPKSSALYAKPTLGELGFSCGYPSEAPSPPNEWSFGGKITPFKVDFGYQPVTWGEAVSRAEAVSCEEVASIVEAVFCEEAAPPAEAVPCDESGPSELCGKKRKKGKKEKMAKISLDPEQEAIPYAEHAPCTEAVIEAASQEDILPKKKGKKGKKTKSKAVKETLESLELAPEPSTSGEPVHDISFPIAGSRTEDGIDLVQHPDESSICASRATHLLVDDEWKECAKCRALIHHLSLELARYMNENKNGFEVI